MSEVISQLIRELTDLVFGLINRVVGDRDEALDLTQDVFVSVLLDHKRDHRIDKIRPYIFRAAYNRALNAKRNRKHRLAGNEKLKAERPGYIPPLQENEYERAQESARLKRALETLADRQKQALTYRFYARMSLAEIAEAMRISEGSVRVHIARGLKNLKQRLLPQLREEKS